MKDAWCIFKWWCSKQWCKVVGHDWEDVEIFEHAFGSEYQEVCMRCGKIGETSSSHHIW